MRMDYLAKNVRFLTQLPGKGQIEAAPETGVQQPAISKIASGETKEPGYRTVVRLAAFYGVTVEDLVGRDLSIDGALRSSQPVGLDVAKLTDLLGTLEAAIEKAGVKLPARTKARLVATLYADKEASAASSAQAVQAALVGILATMETEYEPDATR